MTKSNRQKGAYYLRRAILYFKELGWNVEKLEVSIPFFIKGRVLFSRKDLLGADLIIWKDKEVFLVQVKSTIIGKKGVYKNRSEAKSEFSDIPIPKMIMLYEPRKKPLIEYI